MRFVLYPGVLNAEDAVQSLVDRLVDRVAEEVHRIDLPDIDALKGSAWFQGARSVRQKVLMSAVSGPPRVRPTRGPHLKAIDVVDAYSARLADRLAHATFVVLVEDRESDGILLDILVEELGWPDLRSLWQRSRQVTPAPLEIVSAGGIGSMPSRIERYLAEAALRDHPPRLFVLCDSDLKWPGDEEKREVGNVRAKCLEHGLSLHVLEKRNAENYIPDLVFEKVRDDIRNSIRVPNFNAFLGRSRLQRDFFPVKDGLKESERESAIVAGLYDCRERPELLLLEGSLFAKKEGRPLKMLYDKWRTAFTANGLEARVGSDEIERLLERIAVEL